MATETTPTPSQPLVSIVTIVYNGEAEIARTLRSILAQTYPNWRCHVVDGASKDRTLAVAKELVGDDPRFDIRSEPDKGIYDAMNKGLERAQGEYVIFMNSGDAFYAPDTLERTLATQPGADVYYGDCALVNEADEVVGMRRHKLLPKRLRAGSMRYGMVVCHQSLLVKRQLAPTYDLQYKVSADIDWTIKVLRQARTIVNTRLILSRFLIGGTSTVQRNRGVSERFRIGRTHFGLPLTLWDNAVMLASYGLRRVGLLPTR